MFFTEEQIQRLEKYRKNFTTAVESGFARNIGSIALKDIESIYDEANGSHYSYNSGCSICVLEYVKKVGKIFLNESNIYKKKTERQTEELRMTEVLNEMMEVLNETTEQPKRTYKRKKKVE